MVAPTGSDERSKRSRPSRGPAPQPLSTVAAYTSMTASPPCVDVGSEPLTYVSASGVRVTVCVAAVAVAAQAAVAVIKASVSRSRRNPGARVVYVPRTILLLRRRRDEAPRRAQA